MRGEPPGLPGKIFLSLFLLAFFIGPVWFGGLLVYSFFGMAATYSWDEMSCTILGSRVEELPDNSGTLYRFQVLYSYTVRGSRYSGDVYRFDYAGSYDLGEARALADRYPKGSRTLCYVNPRRPSSSMLQRPGFLVYLFFPLAVVVAAVTGVGLYGLWQPRGAEPVGARIHRVLGRLSVRFYASILFGFILLFGLIFGYLLVPALRRTREARSWPVLQCTILSSELKVHPGDRNRGARKRGARKRGPSSDIEVLYTYTFAGREHKSNRYGFLGNSAGDLEDNKRVLRSLPPQARVPCYVNPAEPAESVLNRDVGNNYIFGVSLSLLFILTGFTGLVFTIRSWLLERKS